MTTTLRSHWGGCPPSLGFLASLLLVVAPPSPAAAQESPTRAPDPRVVHRCMDVEAGPWSPAPRNDGGPEVPTRPPDESADSVLYALPPRMVFTADGPPPRGDGFVIEIPADALPTPHPYRTWRREGDALLVSFSTGFAGVHGRLLPADGGWAGTVSNSSDVAGRLRYRRDVRFRVVECASPPPVPASADRPLLRRVELAGGASLALGEPIPSGLRSRPQGASGLHVDEPVAGTLAGAEAVTVRLARGGVVAEIRLRYPEPFDVEALWSRLEAEYGPGERGDGRFPGRMWTNRTTTVLGTPSHGERLQARLLLIDPRHPR